MPHLAVARQEQVERIYAESHALWGAGLSYEQYRNYWRELSATPWGAKHLTFKVWLGDDGEVLSSLKLYRPRIRLLGQVSRGCVIGAVFTPEAQRRRGHAVDMLRAVLQEARAGGQDLALLFTDIGTRYYRALGFRALPAEEVWGRLERVSPSGPPGWELHPMAPEELPAVRRCHDEWCAGRPLVVLRDEEQWQFLLTRARSFFARLGAPGVGVHFQVARQHGVLAGYLVTVRGYAEWSVREVGARGGDPGWMAEILRAGAAEARAAGLRRLHGWLPPAVTGRLVEWRLARAWRSRAVPMIQPLDGSPDLSVLDSAEAAFLPYQDQF